MKALLNGCIHKNRDVAKFFGGKALQGTKKQKEWAEKIRAEKLGQMTPEQALMACDPGGLLTHSKFWIENRKKSGSDIGAFVSEQKHMFDDFNSSNKEAERRRIAERYNKLTESWGFE